VFIGSLLLRINAAYCHPNDLRSALQLLLMGTLTEIVTLLLKGHFYFLGATYTLIAIMWQMLHGFYASLIVYDRINTCLSGSVMQYNSCCKMTFLCLLHYMQSQCHYIYSLVVSVMLRLICSLTLNDIVQYYVKMSFSVIVCQDVIQCCYLKRCHFHRCLSRCHFPLSYIEM